MQTMRWVVAAALGLALVAGGVGVGIATSGPRDDGAAAIQAAENEANESEPADADEPMRGGDAEKAAAAALEWADREHGPGATVLEVEAGDDGAAYGVELRLADGHPLEVHVGTDLEVVGSEADDE